MAINHLLQLYLLPLVLRTAHQAPVMLPPAVAVGVGQTQVPASHLKMLSLGLVKLLGEVEDNAQRLERQGQRVALEVEKACKALESLHEQSFQAGRNHRQVGNTHACMDGCDRREGRVCV